MVSIASGHAARQADRARVRVRGAVQGVGFRPFIWGLAQRFDMAGWVLNDSKGVLIDAEGLRLRAFLEAIPREAPPLARIDGIEVDHDQPTGSAGFTIRDSAADGPARTVITADAATCSACLADIIDPENRRYRYPFANCTHCGPRFTITRTLPYDRAMTAMAPFGMCSACAKEYRDPSDRRFHAQPNACATCGPQLSAPIAQIVAWLKAGDIVALKGLGGFHLVADARNAAAVDRLRRRKGRAGKPFAVMVANIASAHKLVDLDDVAVASLGDHRRPILIAPAKPDYGLAPGVSEGLPTLGVMLPYTPLHHLLFHESAGRPETLDAFAAPIDLALVMTSANPAGEPLVIGNDEAYRRLGDIADHIVTHDREIIVRCDDSVVRVIDGAPAYLRRGRGATPEPIKLARPVPSTLALGGHLKSTICITRGDEAFLSQHIGDVENVATLDYLSRTADHLIDILDAAPERVACDLHPDFHSTALAGRLGLPVTAVQHHHAHLAAVAAEHHVDGPVLGLALDGYGLGADGKSSWGGELLLLDGADFQRRGHLRELAQPGGDRAARAPWRMAASALHAMGQGDAIRWRFADRTGAELLAAMLDKGLNTPMTSSAGRLFDAACGLLGVCPEASYEGQAPMQLEGLVRTPRVLAEAWHIDDHGVLDLLPLLGGLIGMPLVTGAELFHGTLAAALADWAAREIETSGLPRKLLLSGGCFQNRILSECLIGALAELAIEAVLPRQAPANDGGLSLGQAWVAALTEREGGSDVSRIAG